MTMHSTPRVFPQNQAPPHRMPSQAASSSAPEAAPVLQQERARWRFWIIAMVFALIALAICIQLFRYQVASSQDQSAHAALPQEPAPRGVIVDSQGVPLAVNRYFYQVTATPMYIRDDSSRAEVAQQLNDLAGIPYEATFDNLTQYAARGYTLLADAISMEDAQRLEAFQAELYLQEGERPIHHVQTRPMARRFYPQAELTSHLIGFVQTDTGGITGLEQYYDQFLWQDGSGLISPQRLGIEALPPNSRHFIPSHVGKDMVLSIDRTIQWIAREELARALDEYQAQSGTVIVMEPKSGAILGMANLPDYDPNRFHLTDFELFNNPAISAQYEPGSVFKIITFGAAIDLGQIEHSTIFTDTGIHVIGGRTIFNSNRVGHGHIDAADALARSLNVVTAQIAEGLGPEDFYRYVRLFGFGEATGIDLSGEIAGMMKTPSSNLWSLSDLGTNSFGQGLAVTPLQMANATAAIANDGLLMRPYIVAARVSGNEVQLTQPSSIRQVMSPEAADHLTNMMVWVVQNGSPRSQVPGYTVAGKSGTAQIPSPEGYVERETIVSFVGFAPADDPQFVILVKLDRPNPDIGIWAGETAAPVFSRIAKRLFDHLQIPPDEIRLAQSGE